MYLQSLEEILGEEKKSFLFPCIKDLIENGIETKDFTDTSLSPTRQDVTQFLVAWFKYIGVSADKCKPWMIKYCTDVLSVMSSSSKSKIKHSTKSNIKYIYRSDVSFSCGNENNQFKLFCEKQCPVYDEMYDAEKKKSEQKYENEKSYEPVKSEPAPPMLSVKEMYKEQFENAVDTACKYFEQGIHKKEIVNLLNEKGFKTRTGKKWSYSTLQFELKKRGY